MTTSDFNTMLVETLPRLRSYAMWLTRSKSAADDLLQETAYRVLRSQSQFTMGTNFSAWAFRILRNEYISSLRRSRRTSVVFDELPEGMFAEPAIQEDSIFQGEILHAMSRLRPSQSQVLKLIWASGLSYDEAATTIQCSVGTVKSRLWRARRHLGLLLKMKHPPTLLPSRERPAAVPSTAHGPVQQPPHKKNVSSRALANGFLTLPSRSPRPR